MPSQHLTVSRPPQPLAATALTLLLALGAAPLSASAQLTLSTQLSVDALQALPPTEPAAAEAPQARSADGRPSAWQRLGSSLNGLWSRVQDHLSWPLASLSAAVGTNASDTPADTRSALLADLGSRRSLRSSGLMLYSQDAADGAVRASMGLIHSDSGNWWQTRSDRYAAMRSSYHRLSDAGVLSSAGSQVPVDTFQARPYVGASFSSLLSPTRTAQSWRLNADFGLMSMGNTRATLGSPERSAEDLLRDMRLRPNVKVSLGYSF